LSRSGPLARLLPNASGASAAVGLIVIEMRER